MTTTATINPFATGKALMPDCQGYHPIAILADGELLCEHCVGDPTNPVIDGTGKLPANGDPSDDQWTVVAWMASDVIQADSDAVEQCAHCYRTWVS